HPAPFDRNPGLQRVGASDELVELIDRSFRFLRPEDLADRWRREVAAVAGEVDHVADEADVDVEPLAGIHASSCGPSGRAGSSSSKCWAAASVTRLTNPGRVSAVR